MHDSNAPALGQTESKVRKAGCSLDNVPSDELNRFLISQGISSQTGSGAGFWHLSSDTSSFGINSSFMPLGPMLPSKQLDQDNLASQPPLMPFHQAQTGHHSAHALPTRSQMNINAPIYVPRYAQNESFFPDENTADNYNGNSVSSDSGYGSVNTAVTRDMNTANTSATAGSQSASAHAYYSGYASRTNGTGNRSIENEIQKLRVDLILKNQIIKNLTDQLSMTTKSTARSNMDFNWNPSDVSTQNFLVPKDHFQLFVDLSQTLQNTTEELEDTKSRLEAFVTATSLCPALASSANGNFDEQETTHRIIAKMAMLQEENERLLTMMSYGNRTSLLVEVGILRHELKVLRLQMSPGK